MAHYTPSYVSGISSEPLLYQTIGEALDAAARQYRDRPALIARHQSTRLTYGALKQAVDDVAAGLVTLGLEPGERIGIWSPNKAEWVIAQLATAKAGLILVNINPAYRVSELDYALNKVECRALFLAQRFKSSDYVAMLRQLAPELATAAPGRLKSARLPKLEIVIIIGDEPVAGCFMFSDVAARADPQSREKLAAIEARLDPDDAINIQFTSGTTGFPKGATLTHHNILNNGRFTGARQRLGPDDSLCIPVPLYHCFGMVLGVLACLCHGSAMVFPDEAFDAESVLRAVSEERCTALYGVPTMFIAELEHPDFDRFDLSSLRTGVMAGSTCPVEVMKKVIAKMNMAEVTIGYGMTETSPISFQSMPEDSLEKRVSTVGRIHPHVEVKIADEAGRALPRGQQGELMTRGYSVMLGYWNDVEKTAEAIDDKGWMHTGDLAVMDDEGYVRITGRVKDMIIRGGENIYPREIEEFLYTHPGIADAQIFGVPDAKYGEQICAWVRVRDVSLSADTIRDFCKGQIAHFKIPQHIRIVDNYPLTVTGKVQKFKMREAMITELGLTDS